ncbi:hypothetical protein Hanom_Chr06g00518991 [Helianthus anomalus]
MTTKTKPRGPRFKNFEIWTKMTKVPKPQGPKWQFTLLSIFFSSISLFSCYFLFFFLAFYFILFSFCCCRF